MKITRNGWHVMGIAAAAIAVFGVAVALVDSPARNYFSEAFGPIALVSEPNPDDAAGDALVPSDNNNEQSLPVLAPLDDERVVAALAPIANLACRRDDPVSATSSADDDASAGDALDAPLASTAAPAEISANAPLIAAAAAPIAPVAAASRADTASNDVSGDCPSLLRYNFNRLQTGESQSLCQFRGKVLLVVNTASYCAYTGQYEGLEALYRKYKGRGLVVVGFPSNDFGGQEPGTNSEIAQFCRLTYGVQFPMFEKSSVTKVSDNPLFASLSASTGVAPQWNFYKYVVDRDGQAVAAYRSRTTPSDPELVKTIERALAQKPKD
jgi:glutathione peroxidase